MKVKVVYLEQNDNVAETITAIAWNSNDFNEFVEKLEGSGVDKNKIEQIKKWCW